MGRYARALTKEELMIGGITNITEDGKVFNKNGEVKLSKIKSNNEDNYYYGFSIKDSRDGVILKVYSKVHRCFIKKQRTVSLNRAMWAWFKEEVPEGYVVDHIDNKHLDLESYRLDNLQLLTPKGNVTKDMSGLERFEVKCDLTKPVSFFQLRLVKYSDLYEKAKAAGDADRCHVLRSCISTTKGRIRYWKKHGGETISKEYEEKMKAEKALKEAKDKFREETKALKKLAAECKAKGDKDAWHEINAKLRERKFVV